jgi:hypothetical protein
MVPSQPPLGIYRRHKQSLLNQKVCVRGQPPDCQAVAAETVPEQGRLSWWPLSFKRPASADRPARKDCRRIAATDAAGIDGVTLSFVNFEDELPLPLLRQAGLRQ